MWEQSLRDAGLEIGLQYGESTSNIFSEFGLGGRKLLRVLSQLWHSTPRANLSPGARKKASGFLFARITCSIFPHSAKRERVYKSPSPGVTS